MFFPKNNNRLAIFFNLKGIAFLFLFFTYPAVLTVLTFCKETSTCIAKYRSLRLLNVSKTTCKVFLTQYLNGVYCSL